MSWTNVEYSFPNSYLFHKEIFWVNKNCNCYFAFKLNDVDDWSYYSGNAAHALDTGNYLTSYGTSEALAQTNYLTTVRDGNGKVVTLLPSNFQAKYARMYIQDGDTVSIYEWQPSTYFTAHEIISGTLDITDLLTDAPLIRVIANNVERIKIGKVGSAYGLFGYDASSNKIFELSDTLQTIAGFTFNQTSLYTGSKIAFDDVNAGVHFGTDGIGIGNNVFTVSSAGALVATSGIIAGFTINSTEGLYAGTGITRVQMKPGAGIWTGATAIEDAPFSATNAGVLKADSGTVGGCTLASTSIGSTTFVSGLLGSGWNISNSGTAEFQNAVIRGILRTSVFEKDTISVVNGIVLISKGDVLAADMTALDASTITISGETTFVANEVLRIKDGVDDEWMLVTNAASAPTYTVTRDLASSYGANSNPIWKKGTAVASLGVGTGDKTGFILLDSSSSYSPFIDIYGRNSNTYSDSTLHARLGWLKGITDADVGLSTTDVWGLYSDSVYLKGVIVANTGYIGGTSGWTIAAGKLKSTSVTGTEDGTTYTTTGMVLGATGYIAAPKFFVTTAGALTATEATISGDITATSGYFASVTLGKTGVASGTLTLQLNDTGGDTYINSGKTDFTNADDGFILGLDDSDSNKAKLYIGSSTKYLNWDGTSITILGDIKTAASGERLEFLTSDNKLHFYDSGGTERITIGATIVNTSYNSHIAVNNALDGMGDYSGIFSARSGTHNTASASKTSYGVEGWAFGTPSSGNNPLYNYGVYGTAYGGDYNYGGYFENGGSTTGGPIRLGVANNTNDPSHTAAKGTLWVTSAGILWINTNGGTTWGKVGAQ